MKSVSLIFISLCIYEAYGLNLNVSLYYEALCPDCRGFISQQLFPVYKKLGREINLSLVPFGKATMRQKSGKIQFTCQHGPKECYANEIHSCAVGLFSVEESAEFIYCSTMSTDPSLDSELEKCANSTGISWPSLTDCHESGQGVKLLAQNGYITQHLEPPLQWVPTVFFDGQFNQTLQDDAMTDFERVACELLYYQPDDCRRFLKDHDDIVLQMI